MYIHTYTHARTHTRKPYAHAVEPDMMVLLQAKEAAKRKKWCSLVEEESLVTKKVVRLVMYLYVYVSTYS
jgi:hypothetical protein